MIIGWEAIRGRSGRISQRPATVLCVVAVSHASAAAPVTAAGTAAQYVVRRRLPGSEGGDCNGGV